MKNLGKIAIFLTCLSTIVFADVRASLTPDIVYAGDMATYALTISGENIQKPVVNDICGNNIVSTGSQTSIAMINGDYKKSYTLTYNFVPQKSCTIQPVAVNIDSKIEKSNTLELKVKPMSQDLHGDFLLSIKASKNNVYVGETFDVTFILKQKRDAEVVDSKFVAPKFKGFWVKSQNKPVSINDGAYVVTKLAYRLAAQREGNATITPAQIKIAKRVRGANNWGTFIPQVQWKTYYSNALTIDAKALPQGVKLIGDFTMTAKANRVQIHENEAVNVIVKVQGEGNLEDIESFKPYINGVNVFDEKIEIQANTLTQKLAFVSDTNFTIPSFSLEYFNTKTKKIEQMKTDPIDIIVTGSIGKKHKVQIQREENVATPLKQNNSTKNEKSPNIGVLWLFIACLVGIVIGIIFMRLLAYKSIKKENKVNIKDEKLLLIKLLPYKDVDEDVKRMVEILESNLYTGEKKIISKKEVKLLLKKYDI